MGKHKHSKIMSFWNILGEAEIKKIPKYGKSEFPCYRKSTEKNKHSKTTGFLNISSRAEIHTIPKTWEKWTPIIQGKYGKAQTFQSYGFLKFSSYAPVKLVFFLKSRLIFNISYCFCMFVNKHFANVASV